MTTANIRSYLTRYDLIRGEGTIVLAVEGLIEAPNWSRDGRELVYNADGHLYRVAVDGGEPRQIALEFADRNNNDHGFSPDGKWLAISHHSRETGGQSQIYVVASDGGSPRLVTAQAPSYWHSWSPDGKRLAYVAGRPSHASFKIYCIDVEGGAETQLSFGDGLDDGPDYSSDGRHIYYNSYRNGGMHIWRMEADGSHPERLTDGAFSDWFPHPDPTGRRLVFLRYLENQGEAHPFGRQVQLMLLDLATGEPQALTTPFFGGQGTLNVPSWSPDGQAFAYVRYEQGGV